VPRRKSTSDRRAGPRPKSGGEALLTVKVPAPFEPVFAAAQAYVRRYFSDRQEEVKDPIERLSAGPVHFVFSGWAFVDILPESRPSPDQEYFLVYDHPFSFESHAWRSHGRP